MASKRSAVKGKNYAEGSSESSSSSEGEELAATPVPPKKMKAAESLDEFCKRISAQRKAAGTPVSFKFEKERCKMLTSEANMPKNHGGILYWMSRDQRVEDNWGLIYAQRLAIKDKVPLFVCFCLVPKFLEATLRQYSFMLKGLQMVRNDLLKLKIPFTLLFGEAGTVLPAFVKKYKIGGVITDFAPLRVPRKWVDDVVAKLPDDVPVCQVDAHNVIPLWVTSGKCEYAARTIRPKVHKNLTQYLTEFPAMVSHPHQTDVTFPDPFENMKKLIDFLEIDKTVGEVDWAQPGEKAALQTLKTFLDEKIRFFDDSRNDPNQNVLSNLSPWFHFGQISVARCILEVKKSPHSKGKEAFIEEAVVRRELADNFCYYNENYDNIKGAYEWAQKTLNDHRKDVRKPLYNLQQFETAKTHDDLWNAAQNQLRIEGKMHGFLRMYWAKKILEWSESPEKALEIAIFLNDKYNLDGRDPNGFVGCMWSICGIHDQGWRERTIFGKIRYMNYDGCKRKFKVATFEAKYKKLAKEKGL